MPYQCPVCKAVVKDDLDAYIQHTESHIIELIKKDHPEWVEKNGVCPHCLKYYRQQIKGSEEV